MKRSEVIQQLLNSYHFQYGNKVNGRLIQKAERMKNQFIKRENQEVENE